MATTTGVSRSSFWRCIQFCPTISRYGPNVYGLTGANVNPAEIERLLGSRSYLRVVEDHGWTADRRIWIGYRLSAATVDSGVVGIPAAKRELICGSFRLIDSRGNVEVGTLKIKDHSAWGLRPFLRRSGAEKGDRLLLVFEPSRGRAIATIGDESLIESFVDQQ